MMLHIITHTYIVDDYYIPTDHGIYQYYYFQLYFVRFSSWIIYYINKNHGRTYMMKL